MEEFYHSSNEQELIENDLEIVGVLEAMLFISPTALSITQISQVLDVTPTIVIQGLDKLSGDSSETLLTPSRFSHLFSPRDVR